MAAQPSILALRSASTSARPDDVHRRIDPLIDEALELGGRVTLAGLRAVGHEHDDAWTGLVCQVTRHRRQGGPDGAASSSPC